MTSSISSRSHPTETAASRTTVLTVVAHLCRFVLAGVFIVAAVTKIFDPAAFAEVIRGYELTPASWSTWQAPMFIVLEIALGTALLVNLRPKIVIPAAIALLFFFVIVLTVAISRGYEGDCGCFGGDNARTPQQTIVEDLLFIGLGILAWFGLARGRGRGRAPWQLTCTMLGVGLGLLGVLVGPSLPLPPFATKARAGAPFDHIVVEEYGGKIDEGRKLFALLDPGQERSIAVIGDLNLLARDPEVAEVVAVFQGDNEAMVSFLFEHGPEFDGMGHAPHAALRPYFRRLPVVLAVEDGLIRRAWHESVPSPREAVRAFE